MTTRLFFSRNAPLPVRGNRNLRESWAATNPGPRCAPSPRPPFLYASSSLTSEAHDVSSSSHGYARGWTVKPTVLFSFSSCGRRTPPLLKKHRGHPQGSITTFVFARGASLNVSKIRPPSSETQTYGFCPFHNTLTTQRPCGSVKTPFAVLWCLGVGPVLGWCGQMPRPEFN